MARLLMQLLLDAIQKIEIIDNNKPMCVYVIDDLSSVLNAHKSILSLPKTPIPKPSKNMYQTKRGKWINCK